MLNPLSDNAAQRSINQMSRRFVGGIAKWQSEIATYVFPGTGSYVSVCHSRDNDASNKFQRRYVVLRNGETLKCLGDHSELLASHCRSRLDNISLSCTHSYRGHSPCWGSQAKMALYFISIYLITIGGCAAILNMVTGVYRDIGDIIIYSYTTHIHRKSMKWSVTLLFCKLQTPHQHSWGCFLTNQPVSSEQMRL